MSVKVFLIYFLNSSLRPDSNNFLVQKMLHVGEKI